MATASSAPPAPPYGTQLADLIISACEPTASLAGSRLPTERQLAADLGVTRTMVRNALAVLEDALGSLDRVERVLTVTGFVSSAPDFHQQPAVVDGASKVLADVFGDAGRHTRSAIGVAALPRNGAVEIEVTVAVSG